METKIQDILRFIGKKVSYNTFGDECFWGFKADGSEQMIAELRGNGAIRKLFLDPDRNFNKDKENQFKTKLGIFIQEAINEKIDREYT